MNEKLHYSIVVQWSNDDQAYLVTLPEWGSLVFNPVNHGDKYEEDMRNGSEALEALVASARKHDEALPEPLVFAQA